MNTADNKKDGKPVIHVPWADPEATSVSGGSLDSSPENDGERKKKQPIELIGVRDVSGGEEGSAKPETRSLTEGAVPAKATIVPARVETVPVEPKLVPVEKPEEKKPGEKAEPKPEEKVPEMAKDEKPKEEKKPSEDAKKEAAADKKKDAGEKEAKLEKKIELSEANKVKIAELLYGAMSHYNDKEKAAALGRLEKDFSPRAIQEAARFIGIREEAEETIKDWGAKKGPDEMLRHRMLMRDNKYKPALIDLKHVLLEEKRKELEEAFKGNPDLEGIIKEKLFLGRDGKGEGAYERILLRMMVTELERDIGVHERVQALECPQNVGFVRKALAKIARMPRPLKAMLGAGLFGAGVAAFAPTWIASGVAIPSYLLYRTIRAGTGGVFAAGIQKYIGNPFAQGKLKKYLEANQKQVLGGVYAEIGDRSRGRSLLEEFADMKKYQDVSKRNFDISQKYAAQLHELRKQSEKKYGKVLAVTSLASGIAGGFLGAAAVDAAQHFIFGPGATVLAGGGLQHVIDTHPKGGASNWNFETAKSGDSVWRVIEHDLQHNVKGFDQMPKAQQTYLIDHYKDLVVADPEKFGLQNPDLIQPGWGHQLHSLFEGKAGQEELAHWMGNAEHLTPEQMQHILEYNAKPSVFHPDATPSGPHAPGVVAPLEPHTSGAGVIPEIPRGSVHETIAGATGAAMEHTMTRGEMLLDLHDAAPHFADAAQQFPHLSLAEQEHILSGSRVASIANEMHQLNHVGAGLTPGEVDVMGEINKHWAEMQQLYLDNARHFTGAVREATGLTPENTRVFLSGTVDKVLDTYKGSPKVLEFMRTINPTADELRAHTSIGQVLKARFTDDHFGHVNLDQYVSGGFAN